MKGLPIIRKALPQGGLTLVACSGGIDSMFAADYLRRTRRVGLAYYHHGTAYADQAQAHVAHWAAKWGLPMIYGVLEDPHVPQGQSAEAYWRERRYQFLNGTGFKVVTGHHLDDAVETWVWSSCHGNPTLPYLTINNVYRPFLACRKESMREWLIKNRVDWIEDPSNANTDFTRNYIRQMAMPHLLKVNPGLPTVIQKKIKKMAKLINQDSQQACTKQEQVV